MKMELYYDQDVPLGGKIRKTGAVLGVIDIPDAVGGDVAPAKLKNLIAGGGLAFRAVEARKAETKKTLPSASK